MTFSRLDALNEYWAENPPMHVMVKSFLGFGKEASKPKYIDDESLDEFRQAMATLQP